MTVDKTLKFTHPLAVGYLEQLLIEHTDSIRKLAKLTEAFAATDRACQSVKEPRCTEAMNLLNSLYLDESCTRDRLSREITLSLQYIHQELNV